jgi:hypothetical protein
MSAASIKSAPETMTATFEEFNPAHDFFDYTGYAMNLPSMAK